LQTFRKRQAAIAKRLEEVYGKIEEIHPSLWARNAFLMLVGTVYARLVTPPAEDGMIEELKSLSKILAENRRRTVRPTDSTKTRSGPSTTAAASSPPKSFADLVREVYGIIVADEGGS
jgi:hypothetical protein